MKSTTHFTCHSSDKGYTLTNGGTKFDYFNRGSKLTHR